jgi:NAD(P)-dependent dehydrogenase (short-subunit alcohol dehydrogenase family)
MSTELTPQAPDRVVVVRGANQGLGRALVAHLLRQDRVRRVSLIRKWAYANMDGIEAARAAYEPSDGSPPTATAAARPT